MTTLQHNDVIQSLQELGLSEHEADIYLSVLRQGEASAGAILDDVKLHREQVYRALKRLVDAGLLSMYEKRKRSYYSPLDPTILVNRAKAKIEIAESLQPYLKELHQKKPQTIKVVEGIDAYRQMFEDIVACTPKGSEYYVISGFGNLFYEVTKDFYHKYIKQLAKKDITCKLVGYIGEDFRQQLSLQPSLEVRLISGDYAVPVATVIYGNKVAIEIMDKENLAVITIENKSVADAYLHTFNTLWRLGENVPGTQILHSEVR